ncbi:hypothetical protein MRX96_044212 [Rhipicephalus microplus]
MGAKRKYLAGRAHTTGRQTNRAATNQRLAPSQDIREPSSARETPRKTSNQTHRRTTPLEEQHGSRRRAPHLRRHRRSIEVSTNDDGVCQEGNRSRSNNLKTPDETEKKLKKRIGSVIRGFRESSRELLTWNYFQYSDRHPRRKYGVGNSSARTLFFIGARLHGRDNYLPMTARCRYIGYREYVRHTRTKMTTLQRSSRYVSLADKARVAQAMRRKRSESTYSLPQWRLNLDHGESSSR